MGIVIEPFIEPSDHTPLSEDQDASPHAYLPIGAAPSRRLPRPKPPSARRVVAVAAVAIAAATVVRVPVHDSAGSPDDRQAVPAAAPDPAERHSAYGIQFITNPIVAAACNYLFDVAADALAIDRDDYTRATLTISATRGRTLNDVVHQDLVAARDSITQSPTPANRRATELEAFDIALVRTDAAPCSLAQTPPPQPPS